jgi:hypothetical protein
MEYIKMRFPFIQMGDMVWYEKEENMDDFRGYFWNGKHAIEDFILFSGSNYHPFFYVEYKIHDSVAVEFKFELDFQKRIANLQFKHRNDHIFFKNFKIGKTKYEIVCNSMYEFNLENLYILEAKLKHEYKELYHNMFISEEDSRIIDHKDLFKKRIYVNF